MRQDRPHQGVRAHSYLDIDDLRIWVDVVDAVQRGHVDQQAAAVLVPGPRNCVSGPARSHHAGQRHAPQSEAAVRKIPSYPRDCEQERATSRQRRSQGRQVD